MATEVFQILPPTSLDADVPVKTRGRVKRVYRCRHCARNFKRSEHCARHERVHTQERPFPCEFCDRRYARKDLVKRHERSLHAEAYRIAHPEEFGGASLPTVHQTTPMQTGSSQQRNLVSATSPEGSRLTSSILTPPIDNPPRESRLQFDICALENLLDVPTSTSVQNLSLVHVSPPYEAQRELTHYLPSTTSNPQDREARLGPISDISYALQNDAGDLGFDTISMPTGSPLHDPNPGIADIEPSTKRRRIEVDPLLLLTDTQEPFRTGALADSFDLQTLHSPSADELQLCNDGTIPFDTLKTASEASLPPLSFADLSPGFSDFLGFDGIASFYQVDEYQHPPVEVPLIKRDKCSDLPKFNFSEQTHRRICEDANSRLPRGESLGGLFPTVDDLNRFLSGYVECFHRHFPIIHLPSLDIEETPSPLIFAICSIGAQYRLDRRKAKNLFALAGTLSSYALRAGLPISQGMPKAAPLWIMQTRVLLSLCGIFSGKTNVVTRTVENLGLFAIDYRLRKSELNQQSGPQLDWEDWISRESSKRLLCGMFIVSNLISTTFGISPGFSATQDLDFEVLDEERLWNAGSAQEWKEFIEAHTSLSTRTVRDVMADTILREQQSRTSPSHQISSLTMLLIMHAINIHIWNLVQLTDTSPHSMFDMVANTAVHNTLIESTFETLSRCQRIIQQARGDSSSIWTEAEGPILFNCQALLQIAHTRLFSNTSAFNRLTLLSDSPEGIASAVKACAEAPLRRTPSMMKSIERAYEGLARTVKLGHLLLRKTAALSWSIEYAITAWDACKNSFYFLISVADMAKHCF